MATRGKQLVRMDTKLRESLSGGVIFTPANGVESPLMLNNQDLDDNNGAEYGINVRCRFVKRFKTLALVQILLGIALVTTGLYSHFPIFSGVSSDDGLPKNSSGQKEIDPGWHLVSGEDSLWYGTWIGIINLITGIFGRLATKRSIRRSVHTSLRRTYFLMNAFLTLYCNGIGIVAYIISLSKNHSLIEPYLDRKFTSVMAFISLFLLIPLLLLNITATVYQALATRQCRCWICDPKNRGTLLIAS